MAVGFSGTQCAGMVRRLECLTGYSGCCATGCSSPSVPRMDADRSMPGMDQHENHPFGIVFCDVHARVVGNADYRTRFDGQEF